MVHGLFDHVVCRYVTRTFLEIAMFKLSLPRRLSASREMRQVLTLYLQKDPEAKSHEIGLTTA